MNPHYSQMLHIDTKEIQKKSLGREALYEIVMGIESDLERERTKKQHRFQKTADRLLKKC